MCSFSKESFHFIEAEEISVDTCNLILCSFVSLSKVVSSND